MPLAMPPRMTAPLPPIWQKRALALILSLAASLIVFVSAKLWALKEDTEKHETDIATVRAENARAINQMQLGISKIVSSQERLLDATCNIKRSHVCADPNAVTQAGAPIP